LQIGTDAERGAAILRKVATPPKRFCFSTIATRSPRRAARIAANAPVQLPPRTQTSTSLMIGMFRAGSMSLFMGSGKSVGRYMATR
jgi:hypothetical protein